MVIVGSSLFFTVTDCATENALQATHPFRGRVLSACSMPGTLKATGLQTIKKLNEMILAWEHLFEENKTG